MTDIVIPSTSRQYSTEIEALLPRYNGGNWIVPSTRNPFPYPATLDPSGLSGFGFSGSNGGQTLTIEGGEAVVGGRWLARDTQTTLSFTSSELNNGPIVYLTFSKSDPDTVFLDSFSNLVDNPDASVADDNLCYVCEYQGVAGWGRQEGRKTPVMTEQYPRKHGGRHDFIYGPDRIPNVAGGEVFTHTAEGNMTVAANTTEEATLKYDLQLPILNGEPRAVASLNTGGLAGDVFVTPTNPALGEVTVEVKNTTNNSQTISFSVIVAFDLSDVDLDSMQ